MSSTTRWLAAVAVASLVAAACGGDDDSLSPEDEALIEALTEDNQDLTDEGIDGRCVAEGMVAALGGADAAEATYGITPDLVRNDGDALGDVELSRSDAEELVDSLFACDEDGRFIAVSFAEGANLPDDEAACIADEIPVDAFKQSLVGGFVGGSEGAAIAAEVEDEFREAVAGAAESCGLADG